MVRDLNDVCRENYRKTVSGTGRFVAPRTAEVSPGDGTIRQLRGANGIVRTGARPALEVIAGLRDARPLTPS
jgi:pyruvate/2-oxoglutarate dehydrogenase complex dihydrolipoamide dehydrogenase (E3) component